MGAGDYAVPIAQPCVDASSNRTMDVLHAATADWAVGIHRRLPNHRDPYHPMHPVFHPHHRSQWESHFSIPMSRR
jgi:hypothetical protein